MNILEIRRDFPNFDEEIVISTLTWNALVEPGDRVSGMLRNELGNVRALQKVLRGDARPEAGVSSSDLASAYERWLPRYSNELPNQVLSRAIKSGLQLLLPTDELWPHALSSLGPHAPLVLWFQGSANNFTKLNRAVAVVGSRTCTNYGQRVTADVVSQLVSDKAAVVSGGALGVDAVAHRVTLGREGLTVAVMAGSLDNLYPSGNWELFDEISHAGLLISEMAPGSNPTRWRFLQRNRLIAALTEALIVTEAGWRSGSINSASHAAELGRRVFAVPGPINVPSSAGCNRLIRDHKAEMLLDPADLPSELGWRTAIAPSTGSLGSLELRALDALTTKEQSFENLIKASGLTGTELRIALGGLQIAELASRTSGNGWLRTYTVR